MALELGRDDQGDGTHRVTVAVGSHRQVSLIVLNEHLDTPGHRAAMDAIVERFAGLDRMREGLPK